MLRVFGCACWPNLRPYRSRKLEFRSAQCVFLGYSDLHKGYKCLHRQTGRIYISRDVVFDENVFPFRQASKNFSSSTPPIFKCSLLPSLPIVSSIPASDLSQPHTDKNLATVDTLQCTNESVSGAYLHNAGTSCAEPLGKATLSQQPAETHELHDGVDAASEPLSPSIEALIPAIPSPEQIPSVTRHRMLTRFQDNTLRSKE